MLLVAGIALSTVTSLARPTQADRHIALCQSGHGPGDEQCGELEVTR
jgi:hypothetical protein